MAQKHNQNETQNAPMTRLGNLQLNAQQRIIRGTAFLSTSFSANNPILQLGELGYETDTNKLKIGDGVTAWNDLAYVGGDTSASLTQFDTMPTASADNLGDIVQYVGETDANYTNGYIYQCTGAGEPVVYSWTQIDVQPAPSGLPSQTGNAGKFLTTDGTYASWGNALVNKNTSTYGIRISNVSTVINTPSVSVGGGASAIGNYSTAIGPQASVGLNSTHAIVVGNGSVGSNAPCATQIGPGTNNDANTMKIGNNNGNFEIMSADGTIPAARHASLPAADGTYVLKLVIASGVPTLSWGAE